MLDLIESLSSMLEFVEKSEKRRPAFYYSIDYYLLNHTPTVQDTDNLDSSAEVQIFCFLK